MGVNISVRKITGKVMEELWDGMEVPFYVTEEQDWWDTLRHSVDDDFITNNKFIAIDVDTIEEEQEYFRPENIDKTIEWVNENIKIDGNKHRLLNALNNMKLDDLLCFSFSW